MIRFVLMDLDDTIFDFHKCEAIAVAKTMEEMGIEPTDEKVKRYSEINDYHWKMLERKEITKPELVVKRFDVFLREYGYPGSAVEMQKIYEKNLSGEQYFLPGALEMLDGLKDQYPLYIISNGTLKVQRGRIEKSGIARRFKKIFISAAVGYNKPSKEFFDYCFERIPGFKREEAILLGDSLTSDIQGGINARIKTVWYNSQHLPTSDTIKPDYIIEKPQDFVTLLERLNQQEQ